MQSSANPYLFFGVNPEITGQELKNILLEYQLQFDKIYNQHAPYFSEYGVRNTEFMADDIKRIESLLARRYEFGLNLDKICLDEAELKSVFSKIEKARAKDVSVEESTENRLSEQQKQVKDKQTMSKEEYYMRLELFSISYAEAMRERENIKKVLDAYLTDKNNPKDISPMLDTLISIRFKERTIEIADYLAQNLSNNGIVHERNEFREALNSSKAFRQLQGIYNQIATQERRNELIPELYVMKNMSDTTQFSTVTDETVNALLEREDAYKSAYYNNIVEVFENPEKSYEEKIPENQEHDYGWGIVLTKPRKIIDNEVVNTPIFKGRITVENLGAFTEHSLFQKRKHARERSIRIREKSKPKFVFLKKKLDKSPKQKVIREYYYRSEARKTLTDNILRVTKTDTQGKTKTDIVFSPLSETGIQGSRLSEFIKNVYFSDYMLDIAKRNGGYAGRLIGNEFGFFVSNCYNFEEIASAILFQNNQKGEILDNRNPENRHKYKDATKDTFLELINQERNRQREFNE